MSEVGEFSECLIRNDKAYRIVKRAWFEAHKHNREACLHDEFGKPALLTKFAYYGLQFVDEQRKRMKLRTFDAEKNKWIAAKW